jgi:alkanesulfonate monooxygenase SsuD/methylene tetrahydromethanopterin reductase-like flavin-dependent oxidoreductase (luciferase family)
VDASARSLDRVQHDRVLARSSAVGGARQIRRNLPGRFVGVYDVYRGGPAPSIGDAVQIPVNDPMMVVPVMAAVTEHIGFGVTANLTYEPPYLFARRMSTLDPAGTS